MSSGVLNGPRRRLGRGVLGFIGAVLISCGIGAAVFVLLTTPDAPTGAKVTVGNCRSYGSSASAMVSISNETNAASTFYVVIGFDQDSRQFGTGSVRERVPGAPAGLWVGFVPAKSSPPGLGTLTCTVLRVIDQGR